MSGSNEYTNNSQAEYTAGDMMFRYHNFVPRAKGFGMDERPRAMLWFQGCSHKPQCKGCMSQETWCPNGGREMSVSDMVQLILRTSDIVGLKERFV